jgi:hypothetical protein
VLSFAFAKGFVLKVAVKICSVVQRRIEKTAEGMTDGEGPFPLVSVDAEEVPQILDRLTIVPDHARVVENFELGSYNF